MRLLDLDPNGRLTHHVFFSHPQVVARNCLILLFLSPSGSKETACNVSTLWIFSCRQCLWGISLNICFKQWMILWSMTGILVILPKAELGEKAFGSDCILTKCVEATILLSLSPYQNFIWTNSTNVNVVSCPVKYKLARAIGTCHLPTRIQSRVLAAADF